MRPRRDGIASGRGDLSVEHPRRGRGGAGGGRGHISGPPQRRPPARRRIQPRSGAARPRSLRGHIRNDAVAHAMGVLADRVGERRVIASGLSLAAAALAIAALAPSFTILLVGLLLTGVACASANAASGRTIMGWFGSTERGMAM